MPSFEVVRDTIDSRTGRIYKAGEIMNIEIPEVVERDVEGRVIVDAKTGEPKAKPMRVSSNLRPYTPPADK